MPQKMAKTSGGKNKMIMLDIAEWIANLLVLGIAVVMWAVGIFMFFMLVAIAKKWIKEVTE